MWDRRTHRRAHGILLSLELNRLHSNAWPCSRLENLPLSPRAISERRELKVQKPSPPRGIEPPQLYKRSTKRQKGNLGIKTGALSGKFYEINQYLCLGHQTLEKNIEWSGGGLHVNLLTELKIPYQNVAKDCTSPQTAQPPGSTPSPRHGRRTVVSGRKRHSSSVLPAATPAYCGTPASSVNLAPTQKWPRAGSVSDTAAVRVVCFGLRWGEGRVGGVGAEEVCRLANWR